MDSTIDSGIKNAKILKKNLQKYMMNVKKKFFLKALHLFYFPTEFKTDLHRSEGLSYLDLMQFEKFSHFKVQNLCKIFPKNCQSH